MTEPIENLLSQRILILDGGMGTMIKSYNLEESDFRGERFSNHILNLKGNNDLLSITKPDIIETIHNAFLDAGSDIIETNTFNSTSVSQADYKLDDIVYELNYEATKIARKAADIQTRKTPKKPRLVAGVLGPTNRRATVSPDIKDPGFRNINFDTLVIAYSEALHGLVDGGVDLLLVETIFDTLNSKAAIYAIHKYFDDNNLSLPVMVSGTIIDSNGRTLSGQLPEAFWNSVAHAQPISVGFNCALGADELRQHIQTISAIVNINISVCPNAGHLNEFGKFDHTPQQMASLLFEFVESGLVNIVGGCCGTTPDHIRAIANMISNNTPRNLPDSSSYCRLSGLEPLNFSESGNFVYIDDPIYVTDFSEFTELIREEKFIEAIDKAQTQVRGGTKIISINIDDTSLNGEASMIRFLNLIAAEPEISRVPIILNSIQFSLVTAGLKCLQGKCIANGISLEEGKDVFKANAKEALRLGAAVVVLAVDEDGEAKTYKRMISIHKLAYKILTQTIGFAQEDIILDANIFSTLKGTKKPKILSSDFIFTINKIKKIFPKVLVKFENKIY